jgi:hypothetical protein
MSSADKPHRSNDSSSDSFGLLGKNMPIFLIMILAEETAADF